MRQYLYTYLRWGSILWLCLYVYMFTLSVLVVYFYFAYADLLYFVCGTTRNFLDKSLKGIIMFMKTIIVTKVFACRCPLVSIVIQHRCLRTSECFLNKINFTQQQKDQVFVRIKSKFKYIILFLAGKPFLSLHNETSYILSLFIIICSIFK